MTLCITNLQFQTFRSYDQFSLDRIGPLTVFVGRNAIGKTNILEGIQLLTSHKSFRHAPLSQLIKQGYDQAKLRSVFEGEGRILSLDLTLSKTSKQFSLNGKHKRAADLQGLVPSVMFTPDDLELIKGSMSIRRRSLDTIGFQVNKNYLLIAKDYEKVVRHKNVLLKEEASDALIESINETLITCASQLMCYRKALFDRLRGPLERNYQEISHTREELQDVYIPSWLNSKQKALSTGSYESVEPLSVSFTRDEVRDALRCALETLHEEERVSKRCLVGPHLDTIKFFIDGMDATLFGSQGQQRSLVLAYKFSEAEVIEELTSQKPILLLDDVMSELDENRREALVSYLSHDNQAFVTTANLAYFDEAMIQKAQVVSLPQ